jgi:hypothetical protein
MVIKTTHEGDRLMKEGQKRSRAVKIANKVKHRQAQWRANRQKTNAPILYVDVSGYFNQMGYNEENFKKLYLGEWVGDDMSYRLR